MLQHSEEKLNALKWLKCGGCSYSVREKDLVLYYKEKIPRPSYPNQQIAEEEDTRRQNRTLGVYEPAQKPTTR